MRAGAELHERPDERHAMEQRQHDDARRVADRRPDPKPVGDRRVVRVDRGQDDVHVGEGRNAQDDVRDPPPDRDGGQDHAHREERVAVALVDAGRDHEEGEGQHGQPDQERQAVRASGDDDEDDRDHGQQQGRADHDGRDRPEHGGAGAAVLGRAGVVAHPGAGVGQALADVRWHERPRVVGVDRQVGVAAGGDRDLFEQAGRQVRRLAAESDDRQAERQRDRDRSQEPGQPRREDPDRLPGALRVAEPARRPQGAPDHDDRDDRDEDPQLGLDDRGDDRVDRGPFGAVAPELTEPEQDEHDAERVGLAPHDAVEPGDRVEDGDGRGGQRQPIASAELADHRPGEVADPEIGQDRRDLDQVADTAEGIADEPDQPQDIEVARRVVVEEIAAVEAVEALRGEVGRPVAEGAQVDLEAGPGKEVCDDESKDKTEREDHEDRAHGSLRPGQPRWRSRVSLSPASRGASHRESAPARAWKVDRSVAQGRPADPTADPADRAPGDRPVARWLALAVPIVLVAAALAIYGLTYTDRWYDHFVWQAAAFLEGHAAIRYPVAPSDGLLGNAFFQDVLPIPTADGVPRALLPFPPLPAVVLLPFVAVWGLATNDQVIFTVLAAIDVAICWWAIGRLPVEPVVRLATTLFFAFGTVFWYTAQLATTWYQAHIVAVGLTFLAIGLAVRGDPGSVGDAAAGVVTASDPDLPSRQLPAPHRATAVRRRLPVRSRLHRPPDRRLRRAVLRLRRRRWRLAAPRLVGRSRRGGADPGPRPVRPGHDRPARQPGVRPPVPARDGRLPDARLPRRLGGRGPALPAPERRACPVRHAGRAAGRASRHARPPRRRGLHGSGGDAWPVRPGVPAGRAARHGDERAADQPARTCWPSRRWRRCAGAAWWPARSWRSSPSRPST